MTKILVEVDDLTLARAAERLGTTTKKETIGRALEIVAMAREELVLHQQRWSDWADGVGERLGEVDWDEAWR